jgi:hypothetical protein
VPPIDNDEAIARKALDSAKTLLAEAGLNVLCNANGDVYQLTLVSRKLIPLPGISQLKAWPITVSEDRATDVMGLVQSEAAELGRYATESVTGLIGFEFVAEIKRITSRMVMNLPVDGLPANRDDAIFKLVLNNREGFLRYILLLLGEYTGGFLGKGSLFDAGNGTGSWADRFSGDIPILEELARAFSRSPDKLMDVRAVVNRLMRDQSATSIVPKEFLELWAIFEAAMAEVAR